MESQKPLPTDTWSKELGGGTLTFTFEVWGILRLLTFMKQSLNGERAATP